MNSGAWYSQTIVEYRFDCAHSFLSYETLVTRCRFWTGGPLKTFFYTLLAYPSLLMPLKDSILVLSVEQFDPIDASL